MADYIKQGELKIKCNIEINQNQIQSLSIKESIGSHVFAEVTTSIEPGSLEASGQELNNQPLVIYAEKDEKELLLFSGVIGRVCIEKDSSYDTICLFAYSLSLYMDLERKNRSFQDTGESVVGLIQKITKEHSFSAICSTEDKQLTKPLIQYQETDWEFLLRLSTHLHVPLFVANEYEGRGIYVGFNESREPLELSVSNEKWCMDAENVKSKNWRTAESTYYEVSTSQMLHLGQSVSYKNEIMWPFKIWMSLQQGVLQCTYKLVRKHYDRISTVYNPHLKGISLIGTVLERREEAIKIHLDLDEEQEIGKAFPYPWLPEHGNMVYCMPETGSRILLLIPDEDEQNAIGIQCVRQNGQECGETQTPDSRWFSTDEEKKITLNPSVIELSADRDRSRISIQDGFGNDIKSSGTLLIQAEGKVSLRGGTVKLTAPGEITAVKRQLGSPSVVNICHNLDAMGEHSIFKNIEGASTQSISGGSTSYKIAQGMPGKTKKEMEEKEKREFKLKQLLEEDEKRSSYELGSSIVKIVAAVPQSMEQDKLSQIAVGFRPITGRMKGE